MSFKSSKNNRILDLYIRLCEGKLVNKIEEAKRFGVDERSIQRDIDDIRAFLDEQKTGKSSDSRTITYDRSKKGFVMTGEPAAGDEEESGRHIKIVHIGVRIS